LATSLLNVRYAREPSLGPERGGNICRAATNRPLDSSIDTVANAGASADRAESQSYRSEVPHEGSQA